VNVVCIGSGYVGTVTATAFAVLGHHTTVVDTNAEKIARLNAGKSPIYEPGLEELIRKTIGKTLFAAESSEAVQTADAVFIAVGTPSKEDGTADLSHVRAAAQSIARQLNPAAFTVVVNKSTVPVGTADLVAAILEESAGLRSGEHFAVVSNPEFLREGFAVEDVLRPDRIVIGVNHEKAREVMRQLYAELLQKSPNTVYFETDVKSAELIKYASNAFLAVKISYINEIARLCETLGANALEVAKGMGLDSRIGSKFLQVSSGWSGSCFPKDTRELLATSSNYGCELPVVQAAVVSNWQMHQFCIDKLQRRLKTLNGKQIGILGLTFKPNTDDARETQAAYIVRRLLGLGSMVKVHDPKGMEMFKEVNPDLPVTYCEDACAVAVNADAIVLLTHWDAYLSLDWKKMFQSMRNPYLLDTRNFLDRESLCGIGFAYEGIGN